MLSPRYPAAVVAGNVETSQVITDALFAAFGAMAPAQGTMNNLTFGNEAYQYYETIAGGSGAGPGFDVSRVPENISARGRPARSASPGETSGLPRSAEEHTSELQSLMRISYAVFCLKQQNKNDK